MGLVLPSMVRGFSSSHFSSSICLCFSLMVIWYDIYCLGLSVLALEPCLLHQPNRVLDTMVEARRSECSYLRFVAVVIFVPLGSLSPHSGLRLGRVYLSPPCWIYVILRSHVMWPDRWKRVYPSAVSVRAALIEHDHRSDVHRYPICGGTIYANLVCNRLVHK